MKKASSAKEKLEIVQPACQQAGPKGSLRNYARVKFMPEFGIETKEIDRRKKAFTTLIASFTAGLILGLVLEFYNSLVANLWIYIGCLIVLSSILFLLRWMLFKFFHSYLQVKISWSG
jgi:Na+/proline symporter